MASVRNFGWFCGSMVAHALMIAALWSPRASVAELPQQQNELQTGLTADPSPAELQSVDVELAEGDGPHSSDNDSPAQPTPVADVAAESAVPERETAPSPAKPKLPPSRPPKPETAPEPLPTPEPEPPSDGSDWLGLEDQLPAEPEARAPKHAEPSPDRWVERLLAAERRKRASEPRLDSRPPRDPAPSPQAEPAAAMRVSAPEPEDLGYKLTFAVVQAEKTNRTWEELPLGKVGSVRFRVTLNHGRLEPEVTFVDDPPELLEQLVTKTLSHLRRGRFVLPFSDSATGEHWFEIEVRLSRVAGIDRYTSERPTEDSPGRAYFVLPSGRRFDAIVAVQPR